MTTDVGGLRRKILQEFIDKSLTSKHKCRKPFSCSGCKKLNAEFAHEMGKNWDEAIARTYEELNKLDKQRKKKKKKK